MLLLLLPFLALWIFLPIDLQAGAVAGITVAGLVPVLHFWWKPTPYERVASFLVTLASLYILFLGNGKWQLALPSFVFGVLWLTSAFVKIPLTAYYSSSWLT